MTGLAAARFGPPREVVITDLESHLDMCRGNVDRNAASAATVIAGNVLFFRSPVEPDVLRTYGVLYVSTGY